MEQVEPETAEPDADGFSLAIPAIDTGGVGVIVGGVGACTDG